MKRFGFCRFRRPANSFKHFQSISLSSPLLSLLSLLFPDASDEMEVLSTISIISCAGTVATEQDFLALMGERCSDIGVYIYISLSLSLSHSLLWDYNNGGIYWRIGPLKTWIRHSYLLSLCNADDVSSVPMRENFISMVLYFSPWIYVFTVTSSVCQRNCYFCW